VNVLHVALRSLADTQEKSTPDSGDAQRRIHVIRSVRVFSDSDVLPATRCLLVRIEHVTQDMTKQTPTPWYAWPFVALWKLVSGIVTLTGRLVAVVLGLALLIVGIVLTVTVIGAIVGVPIGLVGLLLILRGIF
jgi:hypothetical protein